MKYKLYYIAILVFIVLGIGAVLVIKKTDIFNRKIEIITQEVPVEVIKEVIKEVPKEVIKEVTVEKIVEKTITVPIEKIITKTIELPANEQLKKENNQLKTEISDWENTFNTFKPDIYNLVTLHSYQELAKLYNGLMQDYYDLYLKYASVTKESSSLQIKEAPEPEKCYFSSTVIDEKLGYYPKGRIVCE